MPPELEDKKAVTACNAGCSRAIRRIRGLILLDRVNSAMREVVISRMVRTKVPTEFLKK